MGDIVIGDITIHNAPDDIIDKLKTRDNFVNEYCKQKNWDRDTLTIEQIMEIRAQEGWKISK
jgi:hypothetical protein